MAEDSGQVTELLQLWGKGDQNALAQIVPAVYQELRRLAHHQLRSERAGHTLQSTALVNEAFMRLVGSQPGELRNRSHFVAIASRLMRQILVESARSRGAAKRDGGHRIDLEQLAALPVRDDQELVALEDALCALAQIDKRQEQVVEMKFFGGLTAAEIAGVLGVSLATVERDWATARIWLRREMQRSGSA